MPVNRPHKIEIIAVGNDLGFVLPKEIIDRHQLREGDEIGMSWDDGGLLLTMEPSGFRSVAAPDEAGV